MILYYFTRTYIRDFYLVSRLVLVALVLANWQILSSYQVWVEL